MAPPPPPETPLQKHLRRMMEALAEGQRHHAQWKERWERQHAQEMEQWARQFGQEMEQWGQHFGQDMQQWARHLGRRHRRRWEKQLRRQAWRDARRAMKQQRRHEEANPFMGWVFALAAVVMVGMAVMRRELWWLVFVALGMGSAAAGILGHARKVERLGAGEGAGSREDARHEAPEKKPEAPRKVEEDPRTARVDALCDKLLAELRAGPGVLRDVVHQPEQTVEGLRKSCHELARRERELRALSSPEDEHRLEEERARVVARVESERDAVVKERLEGALRLLDEQRRQRAELATAASRLEAEHMRLSYTLENLYTQVLRVRSADAASADVAGVGLRRSVEQLGQEMDAVAEALEEVHRDGAPPTRVPTR
ncbi:hypothetical protein [Archangium sp.]|uniref:hypothetical protein n=1 Tax=Archangium sp. TaxID=1872627 RepID=UPI002ED9020D